MRAGPHWSDKDRSGFETTPRPQGKRKESWRRGFHILRQVVAERSQNHVFDAVRFTDCAPPCASAHVGILRPELQFSLGTVVQAEPEPKRALDDALGIGIAVGKTSETEAVARSGQGFGVAAGGVEE